MPLLQPENENANEEPEEDIDDSHYESSGYEVSTETVTSAVYDFIYENGRKYHVYFGKDKYLLPMDEIEKDRLDLSHEIFFRLLDEKLHLAPIGDEPHRILDVGTGTGIWAIDMADEYPSAEIVGNDLSPVQPKWMPPNCRFEIVDAEAEWTYRPDHFDYVHMRNLSQAVTDWPFLIAEAYRCIQPGGFIECCELENVPRSDDGTLKEDDGVKTAMSLLGDALKLLGRPPFMSAAMLKKELEDAGFLDVVVTAVKYPFAPWPQDPKLKMVGAMVLMTEETGYHAYGMAALTRILGMSQEDADRICTNAVNAVKDRNVHTYMFFNVVYGRKPESPVDP
ncbi:S-adenosyl-L-methionine-dependent methyltransferase [Pyronema domesticum]|nr:S-adenosyl-L-methionine-dependent methyltransferase [Pyronema domesticum]